MSLKLKWGPLVAKDPDEKLDYVIKWDDEMVASNDSIDSYTLSIVNNTVEDGQVPLEIDSHSISDTGSITIWFTGGMAGKNYDILSRVVTVGLREMDQTVTLPVKER